MQPCHEVTSIAGIVSIQPAEWHPVLTVGGPSVIRLADHDVDYDSNFKLYMTTQLTNPHYLPEAYIQVNLVNFMVTKEVCLCSTSAPVSHLTTTSGCCMSSACCLCLWGVLFESTQSIPHPADPNVTKCHIHPCIESQGLEEQLLAELVRVERPALEESRESLVISISSDKRQLLDLEAKILQLLRDTDGNLLDDEILISTLNSSKATSGMRLQE